jgi:hypothetical protein
MKPKKLPPLEARTPYRATDFLEFDYFGSKLTGSEAILRLHLKNATTIDLPTSDAELRRLARTLTEAFPDDVIAHLKMRGRI